MILYTKTHQKIILNDQIYSQGGEGRVYRLEPSSEIDHPENLLAKLYIADKAICNEQKLSCLQEIFANNNVRGIGYPQELLYNSNNECVGFLMTYYIGESLYDTVFVPKVVQESQWSRVELATLAINILDRFITLHSCGVLMADVNPFNILIQKGSQSPIFIDVDSYQVNDRYPCLVYTLEYRSPRLVDIENSTVMYRSKEDEYYAIAVLLFKIFLVGKNPYARNGAGTLEANIRNRDFVFPKGYDDLTNMPHGPWQRIWYNMPYKMRNAFYQAFREGTYLSPDSWKDLINDYLNQLKDGSYPRVIFPKGNSKSLKVALLNLASQPVDIYDDTHLRQFDNILYPDSGKQYAFIEFGTNSFRGFELRGSARPSMRTILTDHFNCINSNGEMDLELLDAKLSSLESLERWKRYIKGFIPRISILHAFGGALLRNLVNRSAVIDKVKELTEITFGILSVEEEAASLIKACESVTSNGHVIAVDLNGASMFLASKIVARPINFWEFGDCGSKLLINWLFRTAHVDTRLITKLNDHDKSIAKKIEDLDIPGEGMTLCAFGIIRELLEKNDTKKYSRDQLILKRDNLTSDLCCNRSKVSLLHEDIYNAQEDKLSRKLELRLSLSIYISLMEKLKVDNLTVMPISAGEAYVKYYLGNL